MLVNSNILKKREDPELVNAFYQVLDNSIKEKKAKEINLQIKKFFEDLNSGKISTAECKNSIKELILDLSTDRTLSKVSTYLKPEVFKSIKDKMTPVLEKNLTNLSADSQKLILLIKQNNSFDVVIFILLVIFMKYVFNREVLTKTNFMMLMSRNFKKYALDTTSFVATQMSFKSEKYAALDEKIKKIKSTQGLSSTAEQLSFGEIIFEMFVAVNYIEPFDEKNTFRRINLIETSTPQSISDLEALKFLNFDYPHLDPKEEYDAECDVTGVDGSNSFYNGIVHILEASRLDKSPQNLFKEFRVGNISIEAINWMNQTPFVLNRNVLKLVKNNAYDFYNDYADGDFIAFEHKNYESYFNFKIKSRGTKDAATTVQKIKEDYRASCQKRDRFVDLLVVCEIFSQPNLKLYLEVFLDWRSRIYYYGWPINPTSCKLSRILLSFNAKDQDIPEVTSNYLSNIISLSGCYQTKEHCTSLVPYLNSVEGYDVTASGFQILALLTADEKILELTKFFKSNAVGETHDLYTYNCTKFLDKLRVLISSENKEISKNKITYELLAPHLEVIFSRAFFKELAMCLIYSETTHSRAIKIKAQIAKILFFTPEDTVSFFIASLIERSLMEEHPKIFRVVEYLRIAVTYSTRKIVEGGNTTQPSSLVLTVHDDFMKSFMSYYTQENIQVSFKVKDNLGGYSQKRTRITQTKEPLTLDTSKLLHSITPNFIHHLDGLLASKVVILCRENKIHIYTVHDCFYVEKIHAEKVKQFYFDSAKEIFMTSDENIFKHPLMYFLRENSLHEIIRTAEGDVRGWTRDLRVYFSCKEMDPNILK